MIAYCIWDEAKGKPVAKPLAASDLFSDQTAANGERTLLRAVVRLGLQAGLGVSNTSDGTEHAVQTYVIHGITALTLFAQKGACYPAPPRPGAGSAGFCQGCAS